MARQIVGEKARQQLHRRIQQALAKKPTAAHLNRAGLTAEQIQGQFGTADIPPTTRRKLNTKGAKARRGERRSRTTRGVKNPTGDFVPPDNAQMNTPDWFTSVSTDIDVSIVIPMYKSANVIKDQIDKWDLRDDGLKKEIIYVDDSCPMNSHRIILPAWEKHRSILGKNTVGKIIRNYGNSGFSNACNTGAKYASGKYVVFCNADTIVTPNWVRPMYDAMEKDPEIGMAGNMHFNGKKIDSAGSQWSWEAKSFLHIGRNIHHGRMLPQPYPTNRIPKDLLEEGEREMVTGGCIMVPSKLFSDLQGFDTEYRIGYWEDSDLCMRIREEGLKIWYCPESIIHHETGHSGSHGHGFMKHNRDLFDKRWIKSGIMDKYITTPRPHSYIQKSKIYGKVYGCVIACNEEEFLEASVDSLSSVVDHWIFVIGGNEYAYRSGMCDKNGYPNDSTLDIAHELTKKYGGNVIEPPGRFWKDKVEMRNAYAEKLQPGDWMWMLDGDEVYKPEAITKIIDMMPMYDVFIYNYYPFWNDFNTIGTGKWEQYPQERLVRWHKKFKYRGKNHLAVSSTDDQRTARTTHRCYTTSDKWFYHYTWVRPLHKIRQKLDYYFHQTGNNNHAYVDDVFLKWRESPNEVSGKTHPMGGGNFVPFYGHHPRQVQKLITAGKLDFIDD